MTVSSERIWVELHQQLRAFVARRIANPADVDDVVQEIFVRIHARISTLDDAERLQAWVYQIARNAIADYYRATHRQREQPAEDAVLDIAQEPDTAEDAPEVELARCVTPLLEQLPATYRTALELTELAGLTQQAAAERLGLSHSGMKSRVQRGRRQMRDMLLACCAVEFDRRGGVIDYVAHQPGCGCGDQCGCQQPPNLAPASACSGSG